MSELLKDRFLTEESLQTFSDEIVKGYSEFSQTAFLNEVRSGDWNDLELKQRMRRTTEVLHNYLPDSYKDAVKILMDIAPDVKGFETMVLPDYAEVYGMDFWEESRKALKCFTQYSSSEFGIRPFLNNDLDASMKLMYECAEDKHENVRRFASEGCRPRLPWAMAVPALKENPEPTIPILDKLKDDPSEFVRRSVANHLNDISKDHPEIVLELAKKWIGFSTERDRLIKHALRTLLKAGNPRAMILFGFADPSNLEIESLRPVDDVVKIGNETHIMFDLIVKENEKTKVRLEYAVYYVKANGKVSKKVFKISENEYSAGSYSVKRKLSFKNMTTRKHYSGKHEIAIHVNGVEKGRTSIELTMG